MGITHEGLERSRLTGVEGGSSDVFVCGGRAGQDDRVDVSEGEEVFRGAHVEQAGVASLKAVRGHGVLHRPCRCQEVCTAILLLVIHPHVSVPHDPSRLDLLAKTLSWRHMAPTAPDTLTCYPFADEDPFVLQQCPHIMFAGNQPAFDTRLHEGGCKSAVCRPPGTHM